MAASGISNATSPHGFLIPPHRYLRDRQSEEQRAGGCLLPHGNACPREQGDGALANGTAAFRGGRRSRDSSESGTLLGVGPGLCRTSENSVTAKFVESIIHAVSSQTFIRFPCRFTVTYPTKYKRSRATLSRPALWAMRGTIELTRV